MAKQAMATMQLRKQNYASKPIPSGVKSSKSSFGGMSMSTMPRFKKGGMVKKTGPAIVHKGEKVLTKAQQNKMKKNKLSKAADKMFGQ